jgi:hypothetical protein
MLRVFSSAPVTTFPSKCNLSFIFSFSWLTVCLFHPVSGSWFGWPVFPPRNFWMSSRQGCHFEHCFFCLTLSYAVCHRKAVILSSWTLRFLPTACLQDTNACTSIVRTALRPLRIEKCASLEKVKCQYRWQPFYSMCISPCKKTRLLSDPFFML